MAIILTLAVECGIFETGARHFAASLAERLANEVQVQGAEDKAWWAIAYYYEWGQSRRAPDADVLAVGDRTYAALAASDGYRFALLNWECEQWRTYGELVSGDLSLGVGWAGLVVSRSLWEEAGSPAQYIPFAPSYRWKPAEPHLQWLGARDLRLVAGFDTASEPLRDIVQRDGGDASMVGFIRDRQSAVVVSEAAARDCVDLLQHVRHAAAREAILRVLPKRYWQPGLARLLAESAAIMAPNDIKGGDAEYDLAVPHLVDRGDPKSQRNLVLSELLGALTNPALTDGRAWVLRLLMSCNPTDTRAADAARSLIDDPELGSYAFQVYLIQGRGLLTDRESLEAYADHPNAGVRDRAKQQLSWLDRRGK